MKEGQSLSREKNGRFDRSMQIAILLLMALIAAVTVFLSIKLQKLTAPLSKKLSELHRADSQLLAEQDPWLSRIQNRYEKLITHVDAVDAAEFSAGEIENLPIYLFKRKIAASSALSWIRQAPGLLISLGLLGVLSHQVIQRAAAAGGTAEG